MIEIKEHRNTLKFTVTHEFDHSEPGCKIKFSSCHVGYYMDAIYCFAFPGLAL